MLNSHTLLTSIFVLSLVVGGIDASIAQRTTSINNKNRAQIDSLKTIVGELKVIPLDANPLGTKFAVLLNGKIVLQTDGERDDKFSDFPVPKILYYANASPENDVVVMQQFSWGNACNGGPIWLLDIKKDSSYKFKGPIDFCGGPAPKIESINEKVIISISNTNMQNAKHRNVLTEVWTYYNNVLSKSYKYK